jgi:glycosyltransferase involved in cell wall biosynthesis
VRILWHSNAPWAPTGYGKQTALVVPRLAEHHDMYISSNYGLEAAPIRWKDIPVLPGLGSSHGNETIPGHMNSLFSSPREGLLFTLYDTVVFDSNLFAKMNVASWVPVDHDPPPPAVLGYFRNSSAIPVAMSRYGQERLEEFDPIYVPHAVDTSVFQPRPSNVRESMDVPEDAFLVSMFAANKGRPARKSWQQAFEAFAHLRKRHEDAYLYVHTTLSPDYAQGEDLLSLAAGLELPQESLKFPNQYLMMFHPMDDEKVSAIMATSDVLLNPSMGEGFGVPIVEAAACGTPTIATGNSAMLEVTGPAGWLVKWRPFWTGQSSWMGVPDVPEIVDALEEAYGESDDERAERSFIAREHALDYDIDKVMADHMLPALEEIEERLGARMPEVVAA